MTITLIDWGAAASTLSGQAESGDRCVVTNSGHKVLVAAVDAIGHGDEAAATAKMAVDVLERHAGESLVSLVERCHAVLRGSRGLVMSLALFSAPDDTLSWLGVGNVEARLLTARVDRAFGEEPLLLRSGVVGVQLPALRVSTVPVVAGDTLILATDGVRADFAQGAPIGDSPQKKAEWILATYGKSTDDALVVVARYLGRDR